MDCGVLQGQAFACVSSPLEQVRQRATQPHHEKGRQRALYIPLPAAVVKEYLREREVGDHCENSDVAQMLPAVPTGQTAADGEANSAREQTCEPRAFIPRRPFPRKLYDQNPYGL